MTFSGVWGSARVRVIRVGSVERKRDVRERCILDRKSEEGWTVYGARTRREFLDIRFCGEFIWMCRDGISAIGLKKNTWSGA